MKTLKTLLAAVLMVVSFNALADEESKKEKLGVDYALKTYIDAISDGKVKGLSEVVDRDAKFTLTRRDQVLSFTKSEILTSLKKNEEVQQNCETTYQLLDLAGNQAVYKVIMKYADFSKINMVTINNTGRGWKITNVSSSFQ